MNKSKLWDIVKTVGAGVISAAVPGGAAIVSAVNAYLPDDKQLPSTATGDQVNAALGEIPLEQRAAVMQKEFDVDLAWIEQRGQTVRAMLAADATAKHTTRPRIALGAFYVVAFAVIVCVSLWSFAIATKDNSMVKTIVDGWPFVLSVVGPFVSLLWAYFGILRKEKEQTTAASQGLPLIVKGLFNK